METTLQSFNQKKYAYMMKLSAEEINCILEHYDCRYDKSQFDLNNVI